MAAELTQIYRNEADGSRTLIYPRSVAANIYISPTTTLQDYILSEGVVPEDIEIVTNPGTTVTAQQISGNEYKAVFS